MSVTYCVCYVTYCNVNRYVSGILCLLCAGHFIVVCGYNTKTNVIYYKNPSSKRGQCVLALQKINVFLCNLCLIHVAKKCKIYHLHGRSEQNPCIRFIHDVLHVNIYLHLHWWVPYKNCSLWNCWISSLM